MRVTLLDYATMAFILMGTSKNSDLREFVRV